MMKYNSDKHHRRSIRLRGYDYSQAGAYYVTICTQNRLCLFGDVRDNEMILNEYGCVVRAEWEKLPERFSNIELDTYVIMPNHFHGIMIITNNDDTVGAGFTPAPSDDITGRIDPNGQPQGLPLQNTIGDIIGVFKSLSSNECLKIFKSRNEIMGKLWQRNYYEHIIRDENDLNRIRRYIIANPANWDKDEHYA